jgi:hypothetical protein
MDNSLVDLRAFVNASLMYLSAKCLSERKILLRKAAEEMKRSVDVTYTYSLSLAVFELFKPNGERAPHLLRWGHVCNLSDILWFIVWTRRRNRNRSSFFIFLCCTMTNKCTIISQISHSYMFRHYCVILRDVNCITNSCIWRTCVTRQGIDYKLSEDDTIVSKHVGVW